VATVVISKIENGFNDEIYEADKNQ
jgi:hypothetical protein